ncbi:MULTISPECIES: ABC transporter ATP-binding protein [unclassified Paenibacillus]|uniref:ABC transporter ATP-binding protein n=1 Tax=unclassified Paenibacillus TaxID=185978 RepID=UPI0024054C88|nr:MULTISPECIES: ABC transporter ATP-binding protein [unclassified Paenibacillus]MDF9840558.1 putative ABC transport system ATP-binding protein [Paenibacillus sp. PastF-2]MDF9847140.1 putative ABC transport system ATP-binding protein [Paenibacillus sp. PastM-2]MDF9853712.1 putative ABC transport system ATP-binding protein [Paenibacillus sp. PastF-1]MDH6478802.1 putative ABC transport system ATP-binding protein [Paenibacillus sp. PastH-2]MDH6506534.1 putative ABC transport system ATP-binding pr
MPLLDVHNLSKIYEGKVSIHALNHIRFAVEKGEFVGIMGPSGSGKTTLLNVIATIDEPTSGEVMIGGRDPNTLDRKEKALFRRKELGFVFQQFNLLDTLTVEENIVLPLTLAGIPVAEMERRLQEVAARLEIVQLLFKRTYEISGGQMQRVAIARAMIHRPSLILADEPTGSLDSKTAGEVMGLLAEVNEAEGATVLMVTHDAVAASFCHRVIFIKDGRFYNEMYRGSSRAAFFQNIIDMLSLLGGASHDLSPVRL